MTQQSSSEGASCKSTAAERLAIVTAGVDGISAFSNINVDQDLRLQGYTTYIGTSSIEVMRHALTDLIIVCSVCRMY